MKKNINKKISQLFLLFIIIVVLALISFTYLYKKSQNWQFYTNKSIGPNNKLNIFDNLIFDKNTVFFNSQNNNTYALNKNNGQISWIFSAEYYSPFPPTITDDKVFLANFDGNIYCLDKNTGKKIWQFSTEEQYQPDTPVLKSSNHDLVFIGSRNGALYALNSVDGSLVWKKQFQELNASKAFIGGSIHFGSIYLDDDAVYVFNAVENKFFSISQLDGTSNWQIDNLEFSYRSPMFYPNHIVIKQNKYVLSIDKKTGSMQKINRSGQENVAWEIFKIEDDEEQLLILDDHALQKIDINFREIKWTANNVDNVLFWQNNAEFPSVRTTKEQVIAQTFSRLENQNILLFLDYHTGAITKTQKVDNWINNQLYDDDNIFLSTGTGALYSINSATSAINWKVTIDGETDSLHLIKNQLLVIALKPSGKISLTYLNKETGEQKWTYTTNFISNKKDIYVKDQAVFIFNQDNTLLNKIDIRNKQPNDKTIKKINFVYDQDQNTKDPYLKIERTNNKLWQLTEKISTFTYRFKNFKNIYAFNFDQEIKNDVLEISITHDENLYQNKFTDLKIEAVFEKDNKQDKIKLGGFYYDHNTWKIRFSAPSPGQYKYQINIKSPFTVKKYSGTIEFNVGKKEVISSQQGLLLINNKTVFFPLGIQGAFADWNYNGNMMDTMSNSATDKPVSDANEFSYLNIDDYLDLYQAEAKINIFRYGVDHWTMPLWHSIDPKNIILSVNGGKFGDTLIEKLKNRDMKIIMTIFGFYPPYRSYEEISDKNNQQALKFYLDYVIARYSANIDLWELSNEAEAHELWYEFVIDYLKENDPYHHPISTNWETESAKDLDFLSVHWYNPDITDPGHLANQMGYVNQKYNNQEKAVLISEFGFKNVSYFANSAESMRVLSWLASFQNMGLIFWTQGQNGIYKDPDNANIYLGPKERVYLRNLQEFLPKNLAIPVAKEMLVIAESHTQAYLLRNQDYILAYLLKLDESQEKNAWLNLNLNNKAKLEWIEPKTGNILAESSLEKGEQNIHIPDFDLDLAMKITYLNNE